MVYGYDKRLVLTFYLYQFLLTNLMKEQLGAITDPLFFINGHKWLSHVAQIGGITEIFQICQSFVLTS